MQKYIITFGQAHTHRVGNITIDCDCVVELSAETEERARDRARKLFGLAFCTSYTKERFLAIWDLKHYPRGIINLDDKGGL